MFVLKLYTDWSVEGKMIEVHTDDLLVYGDYLKKRGSCFIYSLYVFFGLTS